MSFTSAVAQESERAGRIVVMPFGSVNIPSGRFGETDLEANPPKTGHNVGFGASGEVGYFFSELVACGASFEYDRFPLDFANLKGIEGTNSLIGGHAWIRYFLPGGFDWWQPYVVLGAGMGRPKARVEYATPYRLDDTLQVTEQESTVRASFGLIGGVGFVVPMGRRLSLAVEPRFRRYSIGGASRTDRSTLVDGRVIVTKEDKSGNRLRAKSDANWFEVRAGVLFVL